MDKRHLIKIAIFIFIIGIAIIVYGTTVSVANSQVYSNSVTNSTPTPELNLVETQPYPPPPNNDQNTIVVSPYPAPGIIISPDVIKPTRVPIPTDKIVAISNDGQIIDFNQNITRLFGKVTVLDDSKFVPPSKPQIQNNPMPLRIIGGDDRHQILDTTYFPWETVVFIEGKLTENLIFHCTGWMLGPSTVVTAGHCIYDYYGFRTFAYNVRVTPAYNSDAIIPAPFGICSVLQGLVLSPWFNSGDIGYDYGIYRLGCKVGEQTGNLGFKVISGNGLGTPLELTGYPYDKGGTTMWAGYGTVTSSDANSFYYDNDTTANQSGSPVWDYVDMNCELCVVAVHSREFDPPTMNQGPRVNNTAFNFFLDQQQFIASQIFLPSILNQQ